MRADDGKGLAVATFAGGCFWCMQPPFDQVKGVIETRVGYTGGQTTDPCYERVSRGDTGHLEAVQVLYDPAQTSYEILLHTFWRNIDPTQADGQFADRGSQYHTAIFYHDAEQQRLAEASKQALEESGKFKRPVMTSILPAQTFYTAEDYHQSYYEKNSQRYQQYKVGSGRAGFIESVWGDGKKS